MMRLLALILLVSACGSAQSADTDRATDIRPQDFVLVPCGVRMADRPCALVVAGGKRVLLGAPSGAGQELSDDDLRQLDAVTLFSLRAADIEGLDEVRNASWQAGREEPLRVIGPEGTVAMVAALNRAFEQADALRIVDEGIPPGGYDAAILTAEELGSSAIEVAAFDTGDLTVMARVQPSGYVDFRVMYEVELYLSACGVRLPGSNTTDSLQPDTVEACTEMNLSWPLTEQFMLHRSAQ